MGNSGLFQRPISASKNCCVLPCVVGERIPEAFGAKAYDQKCSRDDPADQVVPDMRYVDVEFDIHDDLLGWLREAPPFYSGCAFQETSWSDRRGIQSPHSNVAKCATFEWGTLASQRIFEVETSDAVMADLGRRIKR